MLKNNRRTKNKGFTFFEVMVTIVILSVGIVGIYRVFLISLNHQQYVIKRLSAINILSDESARVENMIISQSGFPAAYSEFSLSQDAASTIFVGRSYEPLQEKFKGLTALEIGVDLTHNGKKISFIRRSLVYVQDEPSS